MGASSQFINEEPIYNDEYHSLRHTGLFETRYTIQQSLNSVATTSPEHAPLYFLILNGWVSLVGLHPVTAAMLTLLFMMLAMSMVYRLGTTLVNAEVGVYATFFLSASAFVVFYAQEIRMYVPLIFVVAALLYHYWTIISTKRAVRWWQWVGLYGFSVVSIYMHYFTIFVLLSIGLYHLLFASKTRTWLQIAVAEVLAGVTFLPWLPTVFAGLGEAQSENISRSIVQSFPELLFNVTFSQSNGLVPLVVVLSVASLLLYRRFAKPVRFMWVMFAVTFSLIYLMTTFTPLIPVRRIRYLLMIAPLMMIIWGMGLYYLSRWRWVARALMVGWVVMAFVFVWSDYMPLYSNRAHFRFDQYPPYHRIEPVLAEFEGQHAPVVTVHPSVPVILIDSFYQQWLDRKFFHVIESQPDDAVQTFTDVLDDANAFWLVDQPVIQPIEDYAFYDAVFKDELHPCLTLADEADMRMTYYLKQAISCDLVTTDAPFMLEFENGMQLKNSILQQVGDGQYRFDAWWFQNGVMDESVGFSLQILDGDYNKYYQLDAVVQRQSIATYDIQLEDMPAGDYSVFVILYTSDGYDTIYGRASTASAFERMNAVATLTITD
jgi:hypothetical protein